MASPRNDDPPNWMLEDPPCEVCKKDPFDCICPACPDCGVNGDPKCYKEHSFTNYAWDAHESKKNTS